MQFLEVLKDAADVVERVRAHRVTRNLCNLPGAQIGEDRLRQRLTLFGQAFDFLSDIDARIVTDIAQPLDLAFQLSNRLLEFQEFEIHPLKPRQKNRVTLAQARPAPQIMIALST